MHSSLRLYLLCARPSRNNGCLFEFVSGGLGFEFRVLDCASVHEVQQQKIQQHAHPELNPCTWQNACSPFPRGPGV